MNKSQIWKDLPLQQDIYSHKSQYFWIAFSKEWEHHMSNKNGFYLNLTIKRLQLLQEMWFIFSRIFGGLVLDVKRKLPFYWSDFRDSLSLQCLASILFLYCACMSPVITFGGLLGEATKGNIVSLKAWHFETYYLCLFFMISMETKPM